MHHLSRGLGVPSVQHIRGPLSAHSICKHKVAGSSAVIPIAARYVSDLLAAGVPGDRIRQVDDAVDLEAFRPDLPGREEVRRQFQADGQVLVGLVGRVEPRKRVVEFLEMAAPLAHRGGRVKFLVIGQSSRDTYRQTVLDATQRLGLDGHLVFTGQWDDMPAMMAALDIVVTMSGGSVMFEAQACGKGLLSVRTDGRHSVHTRDGETALCVTTREPGPATEALERLVEDETLRRRLGQAGRAWAEEHLSPAALVEKTQAVYDDLLSGKA